MSLDPKLKVLYEELLEISEQEKILARRYWNIVREIAIHPQSGLEPKELEEELEDIDKALSKVLGDWDDLIKIACANRASTAARAREEKS